MKGKPIPRMRITPKRFIEGAWLMNFGIISADVAVLERSFIAEATALAKAEGVDVQYLDFSKYEDPINALTANENIDFINGIEDDSKPRLLWFDNCDALAPLDVNLTFSLRSVLTTRYDGNVQAVFIASNNSLNLLFSNDRAAFYQSDFRITDYPQRSPK